MHRETVLLENWAHSIGGQLVQQKERRTFHVKIGAFQLDFAVELFSVDKN